MMETNLWETVIAKENLELKIPEKELMICKNAEGFFF